MWEGARGSIETIAHMVQQFKSYFQLPMRQQDFVTKDLTEAVKALWTSTTTHTIWAADMMLKRGPESDEFDVYVKVGTIIPRERADREMNSVDEEEQESEAIELDEDNALLDV